MKNLYLLYISIIIVAFISCTNQPKNITYCEGTLTLLDFGLKKETKFLKKSINQKERSIVMSSLYSDYKLKTTEYLNYLENLKSKCKEVKSNPFFENGKLTSEGELFVKKSSEYIKTINNLILNVDYNAKYKIVDLIELNDILTEDGIYIKYVDYYFNGTPKNLFINLINTRKRNVLVIQNEVINILLLKQKQ